MLACPSRSPLHRHAVAEAFARGDLLEDAIRTLLAIIRMCLLLEPTVSRTITTQKFSKRGLWPSCPDDLLVTGPNRTFTALLHWVDVFRDTYASDVLCFGSGKTHRCAYSYDEGPQ